MNRCFKVIFLIFLWILTVGTGNNQRDQSFEDAYKSYEQDQELKADQEIKQLIEKNRKRYLEQKQRNHGDSYASSLSLEDAEKLSGSSVLFDKYSSVYSYFNLDAKYNSPLKKEMFNKTQEFKKLEHQLEQIKSDLYRKTYYIRIVRDPNYLTEGNGYFWQKVDWDEAGNPSSDPWGDLKLLSHYNLQEGGFILEFPSIADQCPKTFWGRGGIIFHPLPVKLIPSSIWDVWHDIPICEQELLFPISKEKGLIVENNISKIEIYFIFKIDNHRQDYQVVDGECRSLGGYKNRVITKAVRVIMRNTENGDIYFDKVYNNEEPQRDKGRTKKKKRIEK